MQSSCAVAAATDPSTCADPRATADAAPRLAGPFAAVAEPVRAALEARGFDALTAVQQAVLAPELAGRDLQVSSQTGSGKTVALGLVLASQLESVSHDDRASGPRALVIAPTRELAVQVRGELDWLFARLAGVTVECVTGGTSVGHERRRLERNPTVVVGTPGRLLDHVRKGAIDCGRVDTLVLDEADRMLDMGFREEIEAILDAAPSERRTHLVSATFPAAIRRLAKKYQVEPVGVQGTRHGSANEDIQHIGHLVRFAERYEVVANLLRLCDDDRALVFVNTRAQAATLADQLADDGFAAAPISGDLEQAQRTRTLAAFRTGKTKVLVATDVAARGLDIAEVSMVIHTDAPMDAEGYTHRAGRTGRAGRKGRSVLLVSPQRRKKVDYLLGRAKVSVQWLDAPTAATVDKALAKRARRRLRKALDDGPAVTDRQLAHANTLLEETDPATLVARLVKLYSDASTAPAPEPRPVANDDGARRPYRARRKDDRRHDARRYDDRRHDDRRHDDRRQDDRRQDDRRHDDRRHAERRQPGRRFDSRGPSRDRQRDTPGPRRMGAAARFEINYGHDDGATPQRLLALLCRRGDVSGRAIGAIDIDNRSTVFEVSERAAQDFERRARQTDSRDPHLVIRRTG